MRMCNAEGHKRTEKGSYFKEEDSTLPLLELQYYSMGENKPRDLTCRHHRTAQNPGYILYS